MIALCEWGKALKFSYSLTMFWHCRPHRVFSSVRFDELKFPLERDSEVVQHDPNQACLILESGFFMRLRVFHSMRWKLLLILTLPRALANSSQNAAIGKVAVR